MRSDLIHDWRQRLDECGRDEQTATSRLRWWHRARARLFRFLLSVYGDGAWRGAADVPSESATSRATTFSAGEIEGKSPKGQADIRPVLKYIAAANDAHASGSLDRTAVERGTILVAAGKDTAELKSAVERLHDEGIEPVVDRQGGRWSIAVPYSQRERARAVIAQSRPPKPRKATVVSITSRPATLGEKALLWVGIGLVCYLIVLMALLAYARP